MKGYSFLRLAGILYLLVGFLGIAGGVLLIGLGILQFFQPYNSSSGLMPNEFRAIAFGSLWNGFLLLLVSIFAIAFSQLIDLLFELRARLSGTFVERAAKAQTDTATDNPPAPPQAP